MTSMKQALFGGITIFVVALIGTLLIGRIYSDVQAKGMIEAMGSIDPHPVLCHHHCIGHRDFFAIDDSRLCTAY